MTIDNRFEEWPVQIAEIVGPAGAGKTTLAHVLSRRDPAIEAVLSYRSTRYLPLFAGHAILSLPALFERGRHRPRLTWREMRMMVHLQALRHLFGRSAPSQGRVMLLDQGPVYMLSRLHRFGLDRIGSRQIDRWWANALDQWANALDLVVLLDAPDATLVERINARDKQHAVKGQAARVAYPYLADYRAAYEYITFLLAARGSLRVLFFDTVRQSLEQIADDVLAALAVERQMC